MGRMDRMREDMVHHEATDTQISPASRFALGLVCGAAIGAALGLLLAPKTGEDMRHQLSDSAQRAKRRATDAYSNATQTVHDAVARGRKAVEAGKQAFVDARRANRPERPTGVSIS